MLVLCYVFPEPPKQLSPAQRHTNTLIQPLCSVITLERTSAWPTSFICGLNCAAGSGSSPDVDRLWEGQTLPSAPNSPNWEFGGPKVCQQILTNTTAKRGPCVIWLQRNCKKSIPKMLPRVFSSVFLTIMWVVAFQASNLKAAALKTTAGVWQIRRDEGPNLIKTQLPMLLLLLLPLHCQIKTQPTSKTLLIFCHSLQRRPLPLRIWGYNFITNDTFEF